MWWKKYFCINGLRLCTQICVYTILVKNYQQVVGYSLPPSLMGPSCQLAWVANHSEGLD